MKLSNDNEKGLEKPKVSQRKLNKWDSMIMIFLSLVLVIFVITLIMNLITNNRCQNLCSSQGAITLQKISNGKFNLNDACVCYYPNSIKTFILK